MPATLELRIDVAAESLDLRALPPPKAGAEERTVILDLGSRAKALTVHTWVGQQVLWHDGGCEMDPPTVLPWVARRGGERPVQFGLARVAAPAEVRAPVAQLTARWVSPKAPKKVKCRLDKQWVFIEMGQGIISDRLKVVSSELWSCFFIAAVNEETGLAGGYHYPALSLHEPSVWHAMNAWRDALRPTQVILLQPAMGALTDVGGWTAQADLEAVSAWLQRGGATPQIRSANRPYLRYEGKGLEAGDANAMGLGDAYHDLAAEPREDRVDGMGRPLRLI